MTFKLTNLKLRFKKKKTETGVGVSVTSRMVTGLELI